MADERTKQKVARGGGGKGGEKGKRGGRTRRGSTTKALHVVVVSRKFDVLRLPREERPPLVHP